VKVAEVRGGCGDDRRFRCGVEGRIVTVRVQDTQGLLAANPANDDLCIGNYHGKSPFISARVSGRDAAGKPMSVAVPPGQPVNISLPARPSR
jgi:hypothetical protein